MTPALAELEPKPVWKHFAATLGYPSPLNQRSRRP